MPHAQKRPGPGCWVSIRAAVWPPQPTRDCPHCIGRPGDRWRQIARWQLSKKLKNKGPLTKVLTKTIRSVATGVIAAAVFVAIYTRGAAAPATPEVRYPPADTSALLAARKQQQLKTVR